jgi:hypothetical protein
MVEEKVRGTCFICGKPIYYGEAWTEVEGKLAHEKCYAPVAEEKVKKEREEYEKKRKEVERAIELGLVKCAICGELIKAWESWTFDEKGRPVHYTCYLESLQTRPFRRVLKKAVERIQAYQTLGPEEAAKIEIEKIERKKEEAALRKALKERLKVEPEMRTKVTIAGKKIYEILMPGVENLDLVSVVKREESIEVTAHTPDVIYFKIIPTKGHIISEKLENGVLTLEVTE